MIPRSRPSFAAFTSVLVVVALLGPGAGNGATESLSPPDPQRVPHWACWYAAEDLMVRCVLATPQAALAGLVPVAAGERRGRRPLPPIAQVIWDEPGRLATKVVAIPLLGPPLEMSFVRELAEAVMCGPRRSCSVSFDANTDGRGRQRALAQGRETLPPLQLAEP